MGQRELRKSLAHSFVFNTAARNYPVGALCAGGAGMQQGTALRTTVVHRMSVDPGQSIQKGKKSGGAPPASLVAYILSAVRRSVRKRQRNSGTPVNDRCTGLTCGVCL